MDDKFHYLRHVLGLTIDESEALSVLLARYNNYLNFRRVKGFRILVNSARRCEYIVKVKMNGYNSYTECGGKAVVAVVMTKGSKHFSVYLCEKHFKMFISNAVKRFRKKMDRLCSRIINYIHSIDMFSDIDLDGIGVVFGEADKSI